eukprot:694420-Alexandrium_andersonii.AAC.1
MEASPRVHVAGECARGRKSLARAAAGRLAPPRTAAALRGEPPAPADLARQRGGGRRAARPRSWRLRSPSRA